MSKIKRRNYVKKHMDKYNKHKVQPSAKIYDRKKDNKEMLDEQMVSVPIR